MTSDKDADENEDDEVDKEQEDEEYDGDDDEEKDDEDSRCNSIGSVQATCSSLLPCSVLDSVLAEGPKIRCPRKVPKSSARILTSDEYLCMMEERRN